MNNSNEKSALIVDDSKSARFALKKFLEGHGYRVTAAESADEAYNVLRDLRPDLIFLDHLMPGVDGFDVLKRIKSEARTVTIPVVICSSNEGDDFVQQARSRGASDVLNKPPTDEQLKRILERLPKPSPRPAVTIVAPKTKVSPIVEPKAAIEQAVMKAMKSVMDSTSQSHAPEMAPLASPAEFPAGNSLRDEIGNRLRKLSQDIYQELGELKSRVSMIDPPKADDSGELQQMRKQIEQMRDRFDASLRQHEKRVEDLIASVKHSAVDEAHQVAERAVLSAASKLTDQLTENILRAMNRR